MARPQKYATRRHLQGTAQSLLKCHRLCQVPRELSQLARSLQSRTIFGLARNVAHVPKKNHAQTGTHQSIKTHTQHFRQIENCTVRTVHTGNSVYNIPVAKIQNSNCAQRCAIRNQGDCFRGWQQGFLVSLVPF